MLKSHHHRIIRHKATLLCRKPTRHSHSACWIALIDQHRRPVADSKLLLCDGAPDLCSVAVTGRQRRRGYVSGGAGAGRMAGRWLLRRLYTLLAVGGISGGAVLLVYHKMKSTVDQLSWVERYSPANLTSEIANGLGSVSEWLRSKSHHLTTTNTSSTTKSPSETPASYQTSHTGNASKKPVNLEKQDRLLHSEIQELQLKVSMLEKENHDLRKLLSKHGSVAPGAIMAGRQKSLIEMYTDVLNLLTEFDAKSSRKEGFVNTLPQVVVVGDQSSGKTSVLEMVANARIFPRGAGEMMTRSPVMVTMCEGPDHVATLHGNSRLFDLTKETDLKALRKEIEHLMTLSIGKDMTISATPISLTVKGPNLKRMVLVDLPGVISSVTMGMATNTREDIISLCRRYMQNPNAIIMCIQDGGVDAERNIITDLAREADPEGQRTIFVMTKVDMAEKNGFKQERMLSIIDGKLFQMKALGYYAVVTGKGNTGDSIDEIQRYEREYFAKSKLFQNGMLRESQLSTRNMVNAVTQEFWKMVQDSIKDQTLLFKTMRYNLEAEWRNKYLGQRTLDRDDLFELGKAEILNQVASLQVLQPGRWEGVLMEQLWDKIADRVVDKIFMEAEQGHSAGEFNTTVDIKLHRWAESEELAKLCVQVGMETLFEQLHKKLEEIDGGKFHTHGQGLREEVESLSQQGHSWEKYNVDQLKYVQMSALDDKDVPSAEQWQSAVEFMSSAIKKQVEQAEKDIKQLIGPTSSYERWIQWKSQSQREAERQAIALEMGKYLIAEPSHSSTLFPDEVVTIQRALKNQGHKVSEDEIRSTWQYVYKLHFLRQSEQRARKCVKGFVLRKHTPEYACPEVEFFWRVQQVMKRSAQTLRVQILDREVRQLEQHVKGILDSIAVDEVRKKALIRGEAVDKAEQLKQVRMIEEKLQAFSEALNKQKKRH